MTFGELFKFGFRLGRKIEKMTFEEYGEYVCTPRKVMLSDNPIISSAPIITMIANDSRMNITFFEYITFNETVVDFAKQNIIYFRGFEQDNEVRFMYKGEELPNTVSWRDYNLSMGWKPWKPVLFTKEQSCMYYSGDNADQWFNYWMWLIFFPTIPAFGISYFLCWILSGNSKLWVVFLSLIFLKAVVIICGVGLMGKNIIYEYFSQKTHLDWYNFYSKDYLFENYDLVYKIVCRFNQAATRTQAFLAEKIKGAIISNYKGYEAGIEISTRCLSGVKRGSKETRYCELRIPYNFSVLEWRQIRMLERDLDVINWKGVDLE